MTRPEARVYLTGESLSTCNMTQNRANPNNKPSNIQEESRQVRCLGEVGKAVTWKFVSEVRFR